MESRMNRKVPVRFGGREWRVLFEARPSRPNAELGSAFLCADLGITPEIRADHADYLGHWLKVLQNDTHAIFQAAAHAQRAADYLQGLQSAPPSDSQSSQ
jgi:antirestriction protein ArdC